MQIRRVFGAAAVVFAAALALAACGSSDGSSGQGDDVSVDRTVEIEMVDVAFRPATLSVRVGETVKFVFRNTGKATHDAFLGDAAAQTEHEADMAETRKGMAGHEMSDDDSIQVKPGKSGTIVKTFDMAGVTEIGCHEPGHYQAGMRVMVTAT